MIVGVAEKQGILQCQVSKLIANRIDCLKNEHVNVSVTAGTAQITKLKTGDPEELEDVVSLLEIYVDHGLNQFVWYGEHGNRYIGQLVVPDYEDSMINGARHAARYRTENPEKNISEMLSESSKSEYEEAYIKRQSIIDVMGN